MDAVTTGLTSEYAVAIKVRCGTALHAAQSALQVLKEAISDDALEEELQGVITDLNNILNECDRIIGVPVGFGFHA